SRDWSSDVCSSDLAQIQLDLQRQQVSRPPIAHPACGEALCPVEHRTLRRQQWLDTRQQRLGTLQEGFQFGIHLTTPKKISRPPGRRYQNDPGDIVWALVKGK